MSSVMLGSRPQILPPDTYNRIQRRGVNYEKRVVRDLVGLLDPSATLIHGQWLYVGKSFCQPDIIILRPKAPTLIIEVKLSHRPGAKKKLFDVYLPAVIEAFPGPVACAQVFRNLNRGNPDSCDLEYLLSMTTHRYAEIMWR